MTLIERIDNYLQNGGLFNPEMMEHDKVRQLLLDCRDALEEVTPGTAAYDDRLDREEWQRENN